MKIFNRFICLVMVALMLVTAIPFAPASAADELTENYTLTVENTYDDACVAACSDIGGISFFGNIEFDGCYGNQLSGLARELYNSLVKNYATDKKTGMYTHTFEAAFTFDAEISGDNIIINDEFEEIQIEIAYAMQAAMDAFLYDHPEVFWLRKTGSSYNVSASGNSVDGYLGIISDITITPTEIYSGASAGISQYEAAVASVLSSVAVTESRYDILKALHDYICNNAWYNLVNEQRVHSSEPFFIGDGGVVCEGYAKAFKVLCDRLNIPCVLVSGDAGGAHMWNYVQMDDGKWYLVDATWNDQKNQIYYTYFLANSNTVGFDDVTISEERTERNDFSGTGVFSFTYPVLSANAYTVHVHEWESDYTVDVEPTCTEKGSKSIHCKTCDETKSVTEISATEHANKEEYAQKDATCTEDGYTAGVYCADCEKWIEGHEILFAKNHENKIEYPGKNATCTDDGYTAGTYCPDCEQWILGHAVIEGGHVDSDHDGRCENCKEFLFGNIISSGSCGENVTYTLYENGTLIISGSGDMENYDSGAPFYSSDFVSAIIEDGVSSIGDRAFFSCDKLESVIIPDSVTKIGVSAFSGCKKLNNVTVGSGVEIIDAGAFSYCESLENIAIQENVKSIGDAAFDYCPGLKEIYLPASLESMGDTFYGCSGLVIYYAGDIYQWMNVEGWETVSDYFNVNTQPHVHKEIAIEGKASTCSDTGLTEGKMCTVCSVITEKQNVIPAKPHTYTNACDTECNVCKALRSISHAYTTIATKATLTKSGKIETKCSVCGKVSNTTTVYYPKTIKLSATSYTYNGKAQTPSVTVKDSKGKTISSKNYTVSYSKGRKSTGKYSVTITFKGNYSGKKVLYFNILPSKTSKISVTNYTVGLKASWSKVTGASGYKVELLNSKGKVLKTVTTTKNTYTFKKLSKVTTYKIRVTSYKTIDKKAVYSTVSTTITTSTAPAQVALSKVTAGSKSATPYWKTVSGASGYEVQYSASSKFKSAKTATVSKGSSKKTTIKKLTKGKKYYFRVRAYKTVGKVRVYGAWSPVKSVKVK